MTCSRGPRVPLKTPVVKGNSMSFPLAAMATLRCEWQKGDRKANRPPIQVRRSLTERTGKTSCLHGNL
ncbi:hypothetical protein CesoFtcFv8_026795 [Champsocephalus esox]|uniref:Uncharacterized protein n=1 Tax=Champsocephalus esox TaxID=159716 RepID=A0AAN8G9G5_9TELE|nr:hypothetical protein CesoFtcFv8_026795 [Champsocephalus esox]